MMNQRAFTLVELLVVIGVIAVLIGILLPAVSAARSRANGVASFSDLRQLGIGLTQYGMENRSLYPVAAWSSMPDRPRHRWSDAIFPYLRNTGVYSSPSLNENERSRMNKPFHHTCDPSSNPGVLPGTIFWGGYGYNWQYLGNGRTPGGVPVFQAKQKDIRAPAQTIAIADTNGSKNGGSNWTSEGVYVVDPPLMSVALGSRGSRKVSATPGQGNFGYTGGNDADPLHRSTPAERNAGRVNVLFCDGHAESVKLKDLDDFNHDGQPDNGHWNGKANAALR